MPRTTLTTTNQPGSYSHVGAAVTLTAGDASNNNQFSLSGGELVLVRNSGVVSRSITLVSAPDTQGRTKDITESLAAGQTKVFGPFATIGWRQTDGAMYINPEHADLLIGVLVPLR